MSNEGDEGRDKGMEQAEKAKANAEAVDAARQVFEVYIKTKPSFMSQYVIAAVEAQGIYPDKWQCIGQMFATAARQGRIIKQTYRNSPRSCQNSRPAPIWLSLEYEEDASST
jgi:hypothetical protein